MRISRVLPWPRSPSRIDVVPGDQRALQVRAARSRRSRRCRGTGPRPRAAGRAGCCRISSLTRPVADGRSRAVRPASRLAGRLRWRLASMLAWLSWLHHSTLCPMSAWFRISGGATWDRRRIIAAGSGAGHRHRRARRSRPGGRARRPGDHLVAGPDPARTRRRAALAHPGRAGHQVLDGGEGEDPAELAGVGCGCGGPMEWPSGVVSPLNIPGWRAFPLRDRLAASGSAAASCRCGCTTTRSAWRPASTGAARAAAGATCSAWSSRPGSAAA